VCRAALRAIIGAVKRLLALVFSVVVVACSSSTSSPGGGGGAGSSSDECGVPGSTTLAAATDAQRATVCDCTLEIEGGYGTSFPCDGGLTLTNKKDQAACLSAWTPCTNATVADGIACAHAVAEHDRCDLGAALADPRCAYLGSCTK
jgi:hypothetical protein